MLLDKGVVVNADVVVSIGDTKLLGVKVRAAIASFETAAQYGLEFPEGTDMERVEAAASGDRQAIPAAEEGPDVLGSTGPTPSIGEEQSEEAESGEGVPDDGGGDAESDDRAADDGDADATDEEDEE